MSVSCLGQRDSKRVGLRVSFRCAPKHINRVVWGGRMVCGQCRHDEDAMPKINLCLRDISEELAECEQLGVLGGNARR